MKRHFAAQIALVCVACAACDEEDALASNTGDGAVMMADGAVMMVPDAQATPVDAAPTPSDANVREELLLDHKQWRAYDAGTDPLHAHQPALVDCSPPAWFIERNMLEINTGECNYALLEHPSLLSVPAQTEVLLELWHFDLVAPEPAKAHVALLFGDALQWETELDIPQAGNVHQFSFRANRALAANEPIRLHLHNHGQNTWLLATLHAVIPN